MKQLGKLTGYIVVTLMPLAMGGQALAASSSVTQEVHVTAIVPAHRDIILNEAGNISEITSNTTKDVTPDVYQGTDSQANKLQLTPELYKQYRQYVPVGTAKYGVLYKRSSLAFEPVHTTAAAIPIADVASTHFRANSMTKHPAILAILTKSSAAPSFLANI